MQVILRDCLAWWTMWVFVIWALWLLHNEIVFWNAQCDSDLVFDSAKLRAWKWLRNMGKGFNASLRGVFRPSGLSRTIMMNRSGAYG